MTSGHSDTSNNQQSSVNIVATLDIIQEGPRPDEADRGSTQHLNFPSDQVSSDEQSRVHVPSNQTSEGGTDASRDMLYVRKPFLGNGRASNKSHIEQGTKRL